MGISFSPLAAGMFVIVLTASSFAAEVVELKNGQRVEGIFLQATTSSVVIEVRGQKITIPVEQVRAIHFVAPPTPNGPDVTSAAREALTALKAIQSLTRGGVTLRDYTARLNDVNISVNRFLDGPEEVHPDARMGIELTRDLFVLARSAWQAKTQIYSAYDAYGLAKTAVEANLFLPLGRSALIDKCPALSQLINGYKYSAEEQKVVAGIGNWRRLYGQPFDQHAEAKGFLVGYQGLDRLWACASDNIAQIERLVPNK